MGTQALARTEESGEHPSTEILRRFLAQGWAVRGLEETPAQDQEAQVGAGYVSHLQ